MLIFNITGIVQEINDYNKLKIIINDETEKNKIINLVNEKNKKPFIIENDIFICIVKLPNKKDYISNILIQNINKKVILTVFSKKYSFNNINGTSLHLKSLDYYENN